MEVRAFLRIYKNGRLILEQPSKCILSSLRQILVEILTTHWRKEYGSAAYRYDEYRLSINAPDNDDSYGIVVGSGAMPCLLYTSPSPRD